MIEGELLPTHRTVLVYDYPWEFGDEILLRGEECKTRENFKFKFLEKMAKQ